MTYAQVREFVPQRYTTEFSSRVEPAMHLKPGETVATKCVDSDGRDENGKQVTAPPNSLVGPFYIDGAEPGDTLVVKLEHIGLTRNTGIQSSGITYTAVTPEYLLHTKFSPKIFTWVFNRRNMTATTDWSPRFQNFHLALRPFLGCLGTAPGPAVRGGEPQAISALNAGSYGGNLDYNRLVAGTIVYLPVNVEGAYLAMGDGHAAEGDGETSGGAIETSVSVRFRVDLLKQKTIPSVRAESDQYYMALGMGRPLEAALQRATANMLDWLTAGFGLTPEEAQILLGMRARYDVASVAASDANFTVACKISKDVLARVGVDKKP